MVEKAFRFLRFMSPINKINIILILLVTIHVSTDSSIKSHQIFLVRLMAV